MDYEKKYKEGVEWLRDWIYLATTGEMREQMEKHFPELKESEDERIRKSIINLVIKSAKNGGMALHKWESQQMLAWLEKQGEQKTADEVEPIKLSGKINSRNAKGILKEMLDKKLKSDNKVEPKFKVGDIVKDPYGDLYNIIEIKDDSYKTDDGRFILFENEDAYRLWTIQDAKAGDVLVCIGKYGQEIGIIKEYVGKYAGYDKCFETYCYVDCDGIFRTGEYMGGKEIHPATNEQRDLLFAKIKEAGYEWDAKKKELKKIEQKIIDKPKFKVKYAGSEYNVFETKDIAGVTFYGIEDEPNHIDYVKADNCEIISGYGIKESGLSFPTKPVMFSEQKTAWSEEDESMLQNILECLKNGYRKLPTDILKYESWLKSLRPQSQWKPTEEHMRHLWLAAHGDTRANVNYLIDLYNDLKKLKEELLYGLETI